MNERIAAALKNWVPFRFAENNGEEYCRWIDLGDKKISEPFFNDTISNRGLLPTNASRFRIMSDLSILTEWAGQNEPIAPTAFIFHISRCGSTLLSQLLSMQASSIVLSEVPLFDELLRHGFRNNKLPSIVPTLEASISLYGAKRIEKEKYLFIKTDSWHIHFYKELRALYPDTPFIFLYRRPDEVIRSQQKRRGMQSVQGVIEPGIFGFDADKINELSFDEYMAKVVESYLIAFTTILQTDQLALPINYNEGAITMMQKLADFAGFSIDTDELAAMEQRAGFHAKYPEQVFAETQDPEPIPAYLTKAFEYYEVLEQIRLGR